MAGRANVGPGTPADAALIAGALATAGVMGLMAATHPLFAASAVLLIGFCASLARWGLAVPVVLSTVVAVGAMPGLSNRRWIISGVDAGDVAVAALVGTLLLSVLLRGWESVARRELRWPAFASSLFLVAWVVTFARTVADGTPPEQAMRSSRDFAYFALILPLAAMAFTDRKLRARVLIGLGVAVAVTCALFIAATIAAPSLIGTAINSPQQFTFGGLLRIYTDYNDIVQASLLFALFFLVSRKSGRGRTLLIAVVLGLSIVTFMLFQTRARYLTVPLAIVATIAIAETRLVDASKVLKGLLGIIAVLVGLTAATGSPVVKQATSTVVERFTSVTQASTGGSASSDSVAYRSIVASTMQRRLTREDAWPFGLGFLSATSSYDPQLPDGTLRNPDVGFFNVLMTMGIVGTVIFYFMVATALWQTFWAARRAKADRWLASAAFAYGLAAVLSSITLVTLFSVPGGVTSALVLGLGVSVGVSREGSRAHD